MEGFNCNNRRVEAVKIGSELAFRLGDRVLVHSGEEATIRAIFIYAWGVGYDLVMDNGTWLGHRDASRLKLIHHNTADDAPRMIEYQPQDREISL